MKMEQVSANCYAVLNEKNLVCDANSGLINLGGGVVVDTQSDLPHGRQMIDLFGKHPLRSQGRAGMRKGRRCCNVTRIWTKFR